MAFRFGNESIKHYATLHPDLQRVLNEAIKYVDFSITCGYRNEKDQNDAFARGASQVKYPNGNHNKLPSLAVDVAPYCSGIDWKDAEAFTLLAGVIFGIACTMGIKLRLGIDWDGDFKVIEHSFKDRPHIELVL